MKKSDIVLIISMYAVTAFFFLEVLRYPQDVRIYPIFIMTILALLTTLYAAKTLIKLAKEKKVENDFPVLFSHFKARQFSIVFAMLLAYVILINVIGFYAASILFLCATLFFFKIKWQYIALTAFVFLILVYGGFSFFLHVPLPGGLLF